MKFFYVASERYTARLCRRLGARSARLSPSRGRSHDCGRTNYLRYVTRFALVGSMAAMRYDPLLPGPVNLPLRLPPIVGAAPGVSRVKMNAARP